MSAILPTLNANGQKLIERLLTLPQGWVTAAMLAESIGVSRRTVLRELPGVERWIAAAGYRFVRSPGQGLLLDEPPERREEMRRLLNGSTVYTEMPRRQRRQKLLGLLLRAHEPMKTAVLARALLVSESTLAADLDEIGQWVSSYAVTLHRRPGVGVWLEGEKLSCRRAAAALLQSSLTEAELQAVLCGRFAANGAFAALLDTQIAAQVWQVLQQFEQTEHIRLPDEGFLTLAIHCTLTVQQLREQGSGSGAEHPTETLAQRLGTALERAFGLHLPDEEVQYLAQYLAAYVTGEDGEAWGAEELHLLHLAERLIGAVECAMDVDFSGYASLRDNLMTHLRPMLLRVRQQICADNPQFDAIRREYPQLWTAVRSACDTVERQLALPHIPDSEAAHLAMHFGAVLEQNGGLHRTARVVVACPLGMGTGRFLASRIEGEFPTLRVEACCSVRELNPEELHSRQIDLVIATVPLELDYPSITVNPVLLEPDRALLRDAVRRLGGTARSGAAAEPSVGAAAESGLRYTYRLTRTMVQMLDHLCIQAVRKPGSRQGLIEAASRLFCPEEQAAQLVAQQLNRREALGDTYIKPLFALLLHCRTAAVSECRFGYLQAQPPVHEAGKMIMGALVLLAPDTEDPVPVEVMRMVSAQLIEQPELIERLRTGQRDAAVRLLEEQLDRLFPEREN